MSVVVDFSYGHHDITPDALKKVLGCVGGIGYAGCVDGGKNITKAELHTLLDAGFHMGLVIENNATDAIGGRSVGVAQGRAIVAAAKDLGYDWQHCVLFGGYDTDSHSGDWAALDAYMEGFASVVPVPGFYGDSDAIDYLHAHGGADWVFWQSDSRSFSPRNPTPNAHLLQLFNDPRASGLPVDVNNVLKTIPLMGADMPLTQADANLVLDTPITNPTTGKDLPFYEYSRDAWVLADRNQTALTEQAASIAALKAQIASIQSSIAALQKAVASIQTGAVDPAALAQAIAQHVKLAAV